MAENPAINCPACKKKFKTKADVRGKRIKCPFCAESFHVPMVEDPADDDDAPIPIQGDAKDDAPIPIQGETKPAAATVPPAEPEEEGDDPYGLTHLDLAPRCPNCANEMPSAEAVVCLACGYNTLTREWGRTEKTIGVSFGRHMVHLLPGFLSLFALLSCMISLMLYATYWPFWVAGQSWIDWTDHESLRMWGTTLGLGAIVALAGTCYKRFVLKPLPEEIKME